MIKHMISGCLFPHWLLSISKTQMVKPTACNAGDPV